MVKFKKNLKSLWKDRSLILMSLPAVIILVLFSYVPMFGLVIAFKDFNYAKGIWGSDWCGFENFEALFRAGPTYWRVTRNTILYYAAFLIIGTTFEVAIAVLLNELRFKKIAKYSQTIMMMPTFISYVAIASIADIFLEPNIGLVNKLQTFLGFKPTNFDFAAEWWPLILIIVQLWKNCAFNSVLYLSTLAGIDQEMYEAASLDGANAWQKFRYITFPVLKATITILALLSLGKIMHSDTGLFHQVTHNNSVLYRTTQVLDSYVLNSITAAGSDYGVTGATTFYQSVIGFVLVVVVNLIVRKIEPDRALF